MMLYVKVPVRRIGVLIGEPMSFQTGTCYSKAAREIQGAVSTLESNCIRQ